jgi:hypothetical protein
MNRDQPDSIVDAQRQGEDVHITVDHFAFVNGDVFASTADIEGGQEKLESSVLPLPLAQDGFRERNLVDRLFGRVTHGSIPFHRDYITTAKLSNPISDQ